MKTQSESNELRFPSFVEREALITRAVRAYWMVANRPGENVGNFDQHSQYCSGVEERGDNAYVVLRNSLRTLAVYQIRTDGRLQRLSQWPKDIE